MGKAPRKFTIFDAMLLTAATALAVAWTRALVHEQLSRWRAPHPDLMAIWGDFIPQWALRTVPCLTCGSLAIVMARCLSPRPAWRRAANQPGFVACFAMVAVAVFLLFLMLAAPPVRPLLIAFWNYPAMQPIWLQIVWLLSHFGLVPAACWGLLLVGGRWRAEPDWIDRTGRVLGAGWIATGGFMYFLQFLVWI